MRKFFVEMAGNREVALWRRAECDRDGRYKRRKTELGRQLWDDYGCEMYEAWMDDDWFPLDCWCCSGPGPGDRTFEDIEREDLMVMYIHGVDGLDAALTVPTMGEDD